MRGEGVGPSHKILGGAERAMPSPPVPAPTYIIYFKIISSLESINLLNPTSMDSDLCWAYERLAEFQRKVNTFGMYKVMKNEI